MPDAFATVGAYGCEKDVNSEAGFPFCISHKVSLDLHDKFLISSFIILHASKYSTRVNALNGFCVCSKEEPTERLPAK